MDLNWTPQGNGPVPDLVAETDRGTFTIRAHDIAVGIRQWYSVTLDGNPAEPHHHETGQHKSLDDAKAAALDWYEQLPEVDPET